MDVIVGRLRHVEVDDVPECLDVDSARGNVRCDQNLVLAILESRQRRGALTLRAISMNPLRLDAALHQLLGQAIRAVFRAREHQRLCHFATIEQRQQQILFQILLHRVDSLRDSDRRQRAPAQVDHQWIVQHLPRECGDRRRHRRAEQKRLPLGRHHLENTLDVGQESHVQHPVGLVEHQEFDVLESGVRRTQMVEQTAWSSDKNIDPRAHRVFLRRHAHTAINRGGGNRRVNRH